MVVPETSQGHPQQADLLQSGSAFWSPPRLAPKDGVFRTELHACLEHEACRKRCYPNTYGGRRLLNKAEFGELGKKIKNGFKKLGEKFGNHITNTLKNNLPKTPPTPTTTPSPIDMKQYEDAMDEVKDIEEKARDAGCWKGEL